MEDYPILGGVLFAIGTVVVGSGYYSLDALPLQLFGSSVSIYTNETNEAISPSDTSSPSMVFSSLS